jgi:hypothetical protein
MKKQRDSDFTVGDAVIYNGNEVTVQDIHAGLLLLWDEDKNSNVWVPETDFQKGY